MPKNRLMMSPVTCTPKHIPAAGGNVTVEFRAATSQQDAQATVKYAVAPGPPYRLDGNPTASPMVKKAATPATPVSKNVTVKKTGGGVASFINIEVTAAIPGDSPQTHSCMVFLENPLAVQLKELRADADLTQAEIANEVGVSRSTISDVERGRNPSPRVEAAIVKLMRKRTTHHD